MFKITSDLLRSLIFTVPIWYCICRYRWAFIPEVDVEHFDGPENTLLEGEQECKPHVVKILDGINRRYGVRSLHTVFTKQSVF